MQVVEHDPRLADVRARSRDTIQHRVQTAHVLDRVRPSLIGRLVRVAQVAELVQIGGDQARRLDDQTSRL